MADIVELVKDFGFEAAHFLPTSRKPQMPAHPRHSFPGGGALRGPLDPHLGWVKDFPDLKAAVSPWSNARSIPLKGNPRVSEPPP